MMIATMQITSAGNYQTIGDRTSSFDGAVKKSMDGFSDLVKNTCRVLLTGGMKGCYIYFMDKDTERFVRSRMEAYVSRTCFWARSAHPLTPEPDTVIAIIAQMHPGLLSVGSLPTVHVSP